ncbi:MAG: helix-turn-helix domain-containing protein [Hyphomicrobium sp.]|jgi:transcriptional regulator with XRE-family HTH domain|uniref:helix-turn-helix transcriptional regulator n=1 Tax=Hyphomicrobium sp. TaxID=82 RepID=UPI00344B30D8|nr:helix-turn-helix domain-containing protein [Hyphomicrobium sp.]
MERNIQLDWQSIVKDAIAARKRQHLTQKELAAIASLSLPTVNRFEQGDTSLTLRSALKILQKLGLASSLPI